MCNSNMIEPSEAQQLLRRWFDLWACRGLESRLEIVINKRFKTTLGRYDHRHRRISLAAFLLDAPKALFTEVLCHEAAHAAVAELYPYRVRPHGPEWRALMRTAGAF